MSGWTLHVVTQLSLHALRALSYSEHHGTGTLTRHHPDVADAIHLPYLGDTLHAAAPALWSTLVFACVQRPFGRYWLGIGILGLIVDVSLAQALTRGG